jgi:hypothetical protein
MNRCYGSGMGGSFITAVNSSALLRGGYICIIRGTICMTGRRTGILRYPLGARRYRYRDRTRLINFIN